MKSKTRMTKSERIPNGEIRNPPRVAASPFADLGLRNSGFIRHSSSGFTLIELILVMTILTIAVSVTAPALADFFRRSTVHSEARRLLALTHQGQSRAVSEGIPMGLWVDAAKGTYGLEAEPSYEPTDQKAVTFTSDADLQIQLDGFGPANSAAGGVPGPVSVASLTSHPNLPRIRFLPDGSIGEGSPRRLIVLGHGTLASVELSPNGLNYEIAPQHN
ncbi:MAG: hypothetical protein DME25_18290 [Verrucomicrobia bacterium]|nr:MAG: hypothetical protein DME25_18290 [Verrucomicrobiota bacterium]